jgi:hypothetical protein
MNVGKRDEARKTVDIRKSPGFTHPRIVTSFARRRKCVLTYETRYFLPPNRAKLPTRFHEEPKKIKRVILWIAIIIALIIANGFYQSYQTKVLHERAMEYLGQP